MSVLPVFRAVFGIAAAAAIAAVAGCTTNPLNQMFDKNEGGFFSKPMNIFTPSEGSKAGTVSGNFNPTGPVSPDDLVAADGQCAPKAAPAQASEPAQPPQAQAPASPPKSSAAGGMAGELASEPPPPTLQPANLGGVGAGAPPVLGGIALGMTECQAVRRGGLPSNVAISAGDKGERRVILTYLSGPWPGIYHFSDGRLKEVDAAPVPPPSAKPPPKKKVKKKPANAKTSQRAIEAVQ